MNFTTLIRAQVREWLLSEPETTHSVADCYALFLVDRQARDRKPRTLADYKRCLTPFVTWCEREKLALPQLTREQVRSYVAELRTTPRSNGKPWQSSTADIYVRNLRTFLNWLQEEEYVHRDLSGALPQPKAHIRDDNLLTDAEFDCLVAASERGPFPLRDRALLLTFLDTGLRPGEIPLMRREELHVQPDGTLWMHLVMPKTGEHRFAFWGQKASTALFDYLKTQLPGNSHVWMGLRGPLTYQGIYNIIKRHAKAAGFPPGRVHPQLLRKMFATRWISNGGDNQSLQDVVGWVSPAMLAVYVQVAKRDHLAILHRQYSPVDRWQAQQSTTE